MKYILKDSLDKPIKTFKTKSEAEGFRTMCQRYDWQIELIKTYKWATARQKAAVHFCEQWLYITFKGDINNFNEVSAFLSEYLEDAKNTYEEIKCEYESYIWDLD